MTDDNKFHTTTSAWSDNIEKILKELGESCLGYKWMNIFAAKKNEIKYNTLMYTSIVIGPIAGILSAVSESREYSVIPVFVTIFSFISGVISAIIKFSEFSEKSSVYKNTAAKYASLESNIRRQLSLTRNDRVNAGEYLEWISRSYDELFTSSPLVGDDVYQQWVNFAKENNISIPQEMGNVVVDSNLSQLSSATCINVCKSEQKNPNIEIVVQEKTERTRSPTDLTKFSDGKMRYEMARLFRMK